MSFENLGLIRELLSAVQQKGYIQATPIQAKAIPAVLSGRDILAGAQTGTGKTAAFSLPLLQRLAAVKTEFRKIRALVLTPTRELAAQVGESISVYGKNLPLRSTTIFGGVGLSPQISRLRSGVDILVATPGRLLDLIGQGACSLSAVEIFVLDEADRMLDMGFINDIKKVIKLLPKKRQNLMFSATYSDEIKKLSQSFLNNPELIEVAKRNTTAEKIDQIVHPVSKLQKTSLLCHLIKTGGWYQVLVFTRTKHGANKLAAQLLKQGISSQAIHGNKSQAARTKALADFKKGSVQVLVATDIAARGLDIEKLSHVVNFDLPEVPGDYVHRIGRTGRAGLGGTAVSLVSPEEQGLLQAIQRLINTKIFSEVITDFPLLTNDQLHVRENRYEDPRKQKQQSRPFKGKSHAAGNSNHKQIFHPKTLKVGSIPGKTGA